MESEGKDRTVELIHADDAKIEGNLVHRGMHTDIVDDNLIELLNYPIREVVRTVENLIGRGLSSHNFTYANIGDPNAKGWELPPYAGEIIAKILYSKQFDDNFKGQVSEEVIKAVKRGEITTDNIAEEVVKRIQSTLEVIFASLDSRKFEYPSTFGLPDTLEWVVEERKRKDKGSTLNRDDVVWVNGCADGLYLTRALRGANKRMLHPAPSYPATITYESAASKQDPLLFPLDPDNDWQFDPESFDKIVRENKHSLVGIALGRIGHNPTGSIFTDESVEHIVRSCAKYGLFLEDDATYENMLPDGIELTPLTKIAREYKVPTIVLRSASKDLLIPGLKAGWMEFHRHKPDERFDRLIEAVKRTVQARVGSGGFGQYLAPRLYSHPDFHKHNRAMVEELQKTSDEMSVFFNNIPGVKCRKPVVPFYVSAVFEDGVLNPNRHLPISNAAAKEYVQQYIEKECNGNEHDKAFSVYLAAGDNVNLVVPHLTGFRGPHGVRFTALEKDPEKKKVIMGKFADAVKRYINSA